MEEAEQILYMQVRMLRLTAEKLKLSMKESALLFKKYDVLAYIRELWGLFHVEGDEAVFEDVKSYLASKGAAV
jgi:hypothetical protein